MRTAALLSDEKHKIRYKQELEWTNLLDYAMDELFAWNINVQLYRSPSDLEISYSGIVSASCSQSYCKLNYSLIMCML